jgi:hypothetical protein
MEGAKRKVLELVARVRKYEYKTRRNFLFWGCCGWCRSQNIRLPLKTLKRGGEYVKILFLCKVGAFMKC